MPNSGGLRQIVSSALVAGGVVLLIYGVFFHATDIAPGGDDAAMATATGETALIREVAIGGLERDESGLALEHEFRGPSKRVVQADRQVVAYLTDILQRSGQLGGAVALGHRHEGRVKGEREIGHRVDGRRLIDFLLTTGRLDQRRA